MRPLVLIVVSSLACSPTDPPHTVSSGPSSDEAADAGHLEPDDEERVLLSALRYVLEMEPADEDYPWGWSRERGLALPTVTSVLRSGVFARQLGYKLLQAGWDAAPAAATNLLDRQREPVPIPERAIDLGRDVYLLRECYKRAGTRGWFSPARPGFSPNGQWAIVVGMIGPGNSYHGGPVMGIILERTGATWTPRGRKFLRFM